jgi:hypothetical protein
MTSSSPRHRRDTAVVALAACVSMLASAGCSALDEPAGRPAARRAATPETGSPNARRVGHRPAAIPTRTPARAPAPRAPATAVVPVPSLATRTAIGTARAWAIAVNSSSYRDASPGQWTVRARPLVTGREARAEAAQRFGGGGATWVQIQTGRCATRVRDLVAFIPSDVPSGPAVRVVYVSARVVLACATGADYLSSFAAQLRVARVAGRWLVALVRH